MQDSMENKLLIVGAGTFSTEVEELARINGFSAISFLDDNCNSCSKPVIGTLQDVSLFRYRFDSAIVAFGKNELRQKYHELLVAFNYNIPILIHPTAYVSPDAQLSPGCIIRAQAVVSRYANLGEGVIVNIGGLIDHHCEIGAFSMILPGAVVRNSARIEPRTWVKANEVVE